MTVNRYVEVGLTLGGGATNTATRRRNLLYDELEMQSAMFVTNPNLWFYN